MSKFLAGSIPIQILDPDTHYCRSLPSLVTYAAQTLVSGIGTLA